MDRATLDTLITNALPNLAAAQEAGRLAGTWGYGYGQSLRNNGKPPRQTHAGPQLPAPLREAGAVDTVHGPGGHGWSLYVVSDDGYCKRITSTEGGPPVETDWTLIPEEDL
jgi:hypothetical protein